MMDDNKQTEQVDAAPEAKNKIVELPQDMLPVPETVADRHERDDLDGPVGNLKHTYVAGSYNKSLQESKNAREDKRR